MRLEKIRDSWVRNERNVSEFCRIIFGLGIEISIASAGWLVSKRC